MSFRGDDQRRYGHVPPVQYPVSGHQEQQQHQHQQQPPPLPPPPPSTSSYLPRRSSFQNGDDSSFFDNNRAQGSVANRGEDELFLTSPSEARPTAHSAMAGYQHQYQPQSPTMASQPSYNPQAFARSQSTSLPYHPSPRYNTQTPAAYSPPLPSSYTPQAYNPAAYAQHTASAVPQRMSTYAGHGNYSHSYSAPAVPQASGFPQHSNSVYRPSQSQTPGAQTSPYQQQAAQSPQYEPSDASTISQQSTPYSQSYGYGGGGGSSSAGGASGGSVGGSSYFNHSYSNGGSPVPSSTSSAQAPYPSHSQIPVGPNYSSSDPNSFLNRASRSNSAASSTLPSPPVHTSSPGLQRHPTNAPLPSRPPMEDVPEESDWDASRRFGNNNQEQATQDSLIHDIEADLGLGLSTHTQRPLPVNGNASDDDYDRLHRYNSTATTVHSTTGGNSSDVNRTGSTASTLNRNNVVSTFDLDDDDSDPEGAFGVYEMQQADLDDRRFSGGMTFSQSESYSQPPTPQQQLHQQQPHPHHHHQQSQQQQQQQQQQPSYGRGQGPPLPPPPEEQPASDNEFAGMDLGLFSGGYAGNLAYGNEVSSPPATAQTHDESRPLPYPQSYEADAQYPPFPEVDVDYGGTGGLQPPALHRLSFDEGDEHVSLDESRLSGSDSPLKEDYPDMFYHPGLSSRPLPALPPGSDSSSMLSVQTPGGKGPYQHGYSLSADSRMDPYHAQNAQNAQQVERSVSLSSHSHTPSVQIPGRSRTDAADERKKALKHQQQLTGQQEGYDTGTPSSMTYDMITLPSGRRRKFTPSKLTAADIRRCTEPWALSSIASWIREMAEGEPDLKRKTIEEGLIKLFTAKVATMNVADAETLSTIVADSMFEAGILIPEEEWVKFGRGSISGVLWQLTGHGCYAPKLHDMDISGRCYSHHCTRTLKKANLDELMAEDSIKKEDWATFYKVTKEMVEAKPKKEVERQNNLHEIVTSEEEYNNQLDVLRVLYKDQLRAWQPPIIAPNRLDKFIDTVFGKVEMVQLTNKDNLLAQLKYRQNEQGPWVVGFSDIFREWIRKAREAYIAYSTAYSYSQYNVRKEATRNVLFRQFLEHVRNHKRSERLGWDTFLKAPITRLQRYTLLLGVVLKNTLTDSEEKNNLIKAIEEIKNVTLECDKIVDEMQKKVSLIELQSMLVLRPGFQSVLNLDHLGRELILQGDLQRMGSKGVRWVDTHALLFDHYFILAKAVTTKDGKNDKKFDVSKEPIPMPLLFLESMNDDPVSKQKGITAPLARTTAAASSDTKINKASINTDRPALLEHTQTSSSMNSLNAVSRLATNNSIEEGKILYPFKIKHLGHEVYTLYATTPQSRQEWCSKIIEAKTRHARALHTQNAEPFRLRVLSDGAFAYDSVSAVGRMPGISIRGTPLDRAIREMEQVYGPGRGPAPVCRAQVNCATSFNAYGKSIIAIGTDFGVYISEASNPRGWTRSVQINKVTQIAILEEFSVCLIIADRSLISYPLDVVAPVSNFPAPVHDNPRRAPQRLAKDVSFFATARMKDRMLLFYKRKEGMHNTFKVLEPVFQKSTEKKTRLFGSRKSGAGNTESFRDFDEFYLPAECYSLNLFTTYIAVSTAKGIETLTLDRKQTMSVPRDLSMPEISNIAARIRDQRPLGMFKLNDAEFILAYEDCAVYTDRHGEVSRTLIMEYSGKQKKARAATMFGQYLLLFNEDYVEVRNAENGRLRQIIAGRDVRCLDYGFRGPTPNAAYVNNPTVVATDSKGTVKICMSHPEVPGAQIVLEMLLNDGHTEKA